MPDIAQYHHNYAFGYNAPHPGHLTAASRYFFSSGRIAEGLRSLSEASRYESPSCVVFTDWIRVRNVAEQNFVLHRLLPRAKPKKWMELSQKYQDRLPSLITKVEETNVFKKALQAAKQSLRTYW